ncbi:hypothetical protein COSO111634_31795 [Corallococcus soli]
MDQPSETMWCIVTSSTCSDCVSRSSRARSSGPRARSKGRRASSSARRRAATSRSFAGSVPSSSTGSGNALAGAMTCTGVPAWVVKVVRSASWRRTSSVKARSRAVTSSAPCSRIAAGML